LNLIRMISLAAIVDPKVPSFVTFAHQVPPLPASASHRLELSSINLHLVWPEMISHTR
jgi:hypothetical protein